MGDYKKLGKNITLLTIGDFGSKLINFLLIPLYTYVLTTNEYGVADLMFTLVSLAIPFFSGMIYSALMRYSLDKEADHSQLFTCSVVITIIGFALFLVFSPLILLSVQIRPFIVLFIFYYLVSVTNQTLLYFARGINNVREYAVSTIISTLSVAIFNILFLLVWDMGIEGYLSAYVLALGISSLYLSFRLKIWKFLLPIKQINWNMIKSLLRYSLPLIPNSLSWWIANSSDKFILIFFHGLAVSGVYAIAYKIPSVLSIISNIFFSAWTISSVDGFGTEESKKYFSDIYALYTCVQYTITSIVILSCEFLSGILYQNEFYEAWKYVPILAIGVMFHALSGFYGSIYAVVKQTKGAAFSTVIGASVNILFNFLLIPRFFAYGAAIATVLSFITVFLVRAIDTRKYLNFKVDTKRNLLSCIFLLIQSAVLITKINYKYLIELFCLLIICYFNRNSLRWFYQVLKKYVTKFIKSYNKKRIMRR